MGNEGSHLNQTNKPVVRPFDLTAMLSEQYSTRYTQTPQTVLFDGFTLLKPANKNIKK